MHMMVSLVLPSLEIGQQCCVTVVRTVGKLCQHCLDTQFNMCRTTLASQEGVGACLCCAGCPLQYAAYLSWVLCVFR
jgi:hypothetical protein